MVQSLGYGVSPSRAGCSADRCPRADLPSPCPGKTSMRRRPEIGAPPSRSSCSSSSLSTLRLGSSRCSSPGRPACLSLRRSPSSRSLPCPAASSPTSKVSPSTPLSGLASSGRSPSETRAAATRQFRARGQGRSARRCLTTPSGSSLGLARSTASGRTLTRRHCHHG